MIKRILLFLAGAAVLSACTGPLALQKPTTIAATAADVQLIANAIRLAENAGVNPAEFNKLLDECVGMFPALASKSDAAKAEFAKLYAAGNADLASLEALAKTFDAK